MLILVLIFTQFAFVSVIALPKPSDWADYSLNMHLRAARKLDDASSRGSSGSGAHPREERQDLHSENSITNEPSSQGPSESSFDGYTVPSSHLNTGAAPLDTSHDLYSGGGQAFPVFNYESGDYRYYDHPRLAPQPVIDPRQSSEMGQQLHSYEHYSDRLDMGHGIGYEHTSQAKGTNPSTAQQGVGGYSQHYYEQRDYVESGRYEQHVPGNEDTPDNSWPAEQTPDMATPERELAGVQRTGHSNSPKRSRRDASPTKVPRNRQGSSTWRSQTNNSGKLGLEIEPKPPPAPSQEQFQNLQAITRALLDPRHKEILYAAMYKMFMSLRNKGKDVCEATGNIAVSKTKPGVCYDETLWTGLRYRLSSSKTSHLKRTTNCLERYKPRGDQSYNGDSVQVPKKQDIMCFQYAGTIRELLENYGTVKQLPD